MNIGSVLSSLASIAVGALGAYATFYFHGALARREQIARSLADFYSSAATVYYSARDYQRAPESGGDRVTYYKLFDQHYKEFLSASTFLASLVEPKLREEVLRIEDIWDEINDSGFVAVPGKTWFDTLDAIRYKILDKAAYSRLTDPFWKS
jgi:hypothetical protein